MIRTSAQRPTGTVSYLFTDIEGSTALWDAAPTAMSLAQARHDGILQRAFEFCGGYVFSISGDGYGVAFATAGRALDAALAIQRDLSAESWPAGVEVRVRSGVHTGEAEERSGNYYGPSVNHGARLMGAANGGQIVVSAVTAALLAGRPDIDLIDLGSVALRGATAALSVFGVAAEGAPWLDRPLTTTQGSTGNLPRLPTSFIGDLASVQELGRNVLTGALTTLTGPGGIGKSRLATEVAWQLVDDFPDGTWLAELAPLAADGDPVQVIASTLSIQPQPGLTTVEAVVDWCFGRRMLLVIDNCEHVQRPVTELTAAILSACPTVALLATSQVPLGLAGEHVVPLKGLDDQTGTELFLSRATDSAGPFVGAGGRDDVADVQTLCQRLDGVPLAIELAAAQSRMLSPGELLARLNDRLRLLRSNNVFTDSRHQTLRATVDWSYALLSGGQQRFFDNLSVFAGSFDLDAVVAVVTERGVRSDEHFVFDQLQGLVDKSMVAATAVDGTTRFRVLETLRQYGAERLELRGRTGIVQDRHLAHYVTTAARVHDEWFSRDQPGADQKFEQDWDNLRAAHRYALAARRPAEAQSLVISTAWHGLERLRNEHRAWAADALSLGTELDATHPTTFAVAAAWDYFAADLEQAITHARQGVDAHVDHSEVGGCLAWLLYALLGADLVDAAAEIVPVLASQLDRSIPLDVEFMSRMALTDASLCDPEQAHETAFAALCRTIASPVALARSAQLRANRRLSMVPPDVEGALASYRRALEVGGDHAPSERLWSLGGMATCLVLADDSAASGALREAIKASYDARLWFGLDLVLGTSASYLLGRSPRAAATILGHVLPRPPSAIGATTTARRAALAEVSAWDGGLRWLEDGEDMERHAIVAYALDALVAAEGPDSVGLESPESEGAGSIRFSDSTESA
ncbi:MAG: adenylate/guanylate cyclase domain-containing protein [Ornithinimicrobium sp.]